MEMTTISINTALYNQAQNIARKQNMSIDEWISSLIIHFTPKKKEEKYKMKQIEELSEELQSIIGFAKPNDSSEENDINGDYARMEYLKEKYAL